MTQIKTALLAALLLAASACAGSDDAQVSRNQVGIDATAPTIVIVDLPEGDAANSLSTRLEEARADELGFTTELDAQLIEDYGDICECTTQECQNEWVERAFGCDICVFSECEGSLRRGACVTCE